MMKRHIPSLRGRGLRCSTAALLALLALGGADQVPAQAGHAQAGYAQADRGDVGTGHPLTREVRLSSSLPPALDTSTGNALSLPSWSGIPTTVFSAYARAADFEHTSDPGCHLGWPLLAAIGKVESNHAEGGGVTRNGTMVQPLFGPPLDGSNGTKVLHVFFGDDRPQWVRAEGPMQFLPSTWAKWGSDGDGDGDKNVQNVYDASLGAARYLCSGNTDLATPSGMREAILRYNPSRNYLDAVASWLSVYTKGMIIVPDQLGGRPGTLDSPDVSEPSEPAARATPAPAPPQRQAHEDPPPQAQQPSPQQPAPAPRPQPSPLPIGQLLRPVTNVVNDVTQPRVGFHVD